MSTEINFYRTKNETKNFLTFPFCIILLQSEMKGDRKKRSCFSSGFSFVWYLQSHTYNSVFFFLSFLHFFIHEGSMKPSKRNNVNIIMDRNSVLPHTITSTGTGTSCHVLLKFHRWKREKNEKKTYLANDSPLINCINVYPHMTTMGSTWRTMLRVCMYACIVIRIGSLSWIIILFDAFRCNTWHI